MKSKYQIEATRLQRFAALLQARAVLLGRQELFEHRRKNDFVGSKAESWEAWVLYAYDMVWAAQQACIEYELEYPMER